MGFNLSTDLNIEEITLNKHGDKTYISMDDSTLFDRFVKCFDFIIKKSESNKTEIEEIEKKYQGKDSIEDEIEMAVELSKVNVGFSVEAIAEIDGIFGEGTIKKYFRDHYEKIPTFLPGVDCFMEFFDKIIPVMEELFGRQVKEREKASKARMAKYQPQDHKRKGSK